jgi:ubiquinone/menaquinone biosynthesis C-methylase UbiE
MFIKNIKCKICKREGVNVLKLKYSDKKILDFFSQEYDKKTSILLKKIIGNRNFELQKCIKCDFIWQTYTPNKIFYKNIYDQIINPNLSLDKAHKIKTYQKENYKREIIFFQNFCDNKKMKVLDFGAGWGTWLLAIKDFCPNIFATELSLHRKKYLKKKNIKIINEKKLDDYKNFFDVIRLEQVLEHVDLLDDILRMLKKMLKKRGMISIGVPDGRFEIKKNIFKIKKGPIQPLEHLNCFNNKSLKLLFKKNGFESISLIKILLLFLKNKKINFQNIKFFIIMIKNSILSTKINFIKN